MSIYAFLGVIVAMALAVVAIVLYGIFGMEKDMDGY